MEVGEKPFPCKIAGCKASFATEDHLNAHQSTRHDDSGMLNLELPNKSNLFADQTPTPTRLIGKCEEVGLFEDLQNVNPFEETFRRAVEEKSESGTEGGDPGKTATTPAAGTGDDTLHTPHVFPLLERRESIKERTYKLSKLFISRSVSRKEEVSSQPPPIVAADLKRKANDANVLIAPKKVPVAILPKTIPIQPETASISGASSDTDPNPVKVKLKRYLARNDPTPVELSKSMPKKVAQKSPDITNITKLPERNANNPQQEDKEKTEKHERWKAAAKRYRTRLKQNQDLIAQRNVTLEEENARLKAEVVRLRALLQLHRDCSVTTRALPTGVVTTAGPSKVQQQPTTAPQLVPGGNPVYIVIAGSPPPGLMVAAAQNHPAEKRS